MPIDKETTGLSHLLIVARAHTVVQDIKRQALAEAAESGILGVLNPSESKRKPVNLFRAVMDESSTCLGHKERETRRNKIGKLSTRPRETVDENCRVLIKKGPVSVGGDQPQGAGGQL